MPSIEPRVAASLPGWLYKLRDALEFNAKGNIPRNSPISTVVHTVMGMAGAASVTLGVAALMPKPDPDRPDDWNRDSYLNTARNTVMAASALTVFITAGMQFNTPQHLPLARGLNPLYFLGVGGWAFANFVVPQFQDAYKPEVK